MIVKQEYIYVPPKIYHARIENNSTTPVVLKNTTGATATVTYGASGYTFTFNSAILTGSVSLIASIASPDTGSGAEWVYTAYIFSSTVAIVKVTDTAASGDADYFEIIITIY